MTDQDNKSLKKIEILLQQLLAVQLYQAGATQLEIAKHLNISTGKTSEMLKGVKKGRSPSLTRQIDQSEGAVAK